jgi:hypothetical protein
MRNVLASVRRRLEPRHWFYLVVFIAAVAVYRTALLTLHDLEGPTEVWKYAGLFLGPTLVAVGWVVTNEVNIRNSRKQHTINLILQYFTNTKRIDDKEEINKALHGGAKIAPTDKGFNDPDNKLLRTVVRELNFFDFLASAILRNEIDEGLMRRVFRDLVCRHCKQLWPYIEHCRKGNRETWADFVKLYGMWRLPSDPAHEVEGV